MYAFLSFLSFLSSCPSFFRSHCLFSDTFLIFEASLPYSGCETTRCPRRSFLLRVPRIFQKAETRGAGRGGRLKVVRDTEVEKRKSNSAEADNDRSGSAAEKRRSTTTKIEREAQKQTMSKLRKLRTSLASKPEAQTHCHVSLAAYREPRAAVVRCTKLTNEKQNTGLAA